MYVESLHVLQSTHQKSSENLLSTMTIRVRGVAIIPVFPVHVNLTVYVPGLRRSTEYESDIETLFFLLAT
jgi:hypothetical protein